LQDPTANIFFTLSFGWILLTCRITPPILPKAIRKAEVKRIVMEAIPLNLQASKGAGHSPNEVK